MGRGVLYPIFRTKQVFQEAIKTILSYMKFSSFVTRYSLSDTPDWNILYTHFRKLQRKAKNNFDFPTWEKREDEPRTVSALIEIILTRREISARRALVTFPFNLRPSDVIKTGDQTKEDLHSRDCRIRSSGNGRRMKVVRSNNMSSDSRRTMNDSIVEEIASSMSYLAIHEKNKRQWLILV